MMHELPYEDVLANLQRLTVNGYDRSSFVEYLSRSMVYRLVWDHHITEDEFEWWSMMQYQSGRDDANSNR
jgi:hypothetical protein